MAKNIDEERNLFWRLDGWGAPILGVLTILLVLLGISASQAEPSNATADACASDDCGDLRPGRWGHKHEGHRFFGRRSHDPERAKEHMQFATAWMLRKLDVEDGVREQIQLRLDTAFDELAPLVMAHKDSHDAWIQSLLGSEVVDRQALAAQREATLDAAGEAMQIVTDALADVADMLTPEQRAELAGKIQRHHH